jgi:LemA protein
LLNICAIAKLSGAINQAGVVKMSGTAIGVTAAVVAIAVLLWAISVYNGLVRLSSMKEEAWNGMDVLLKRRFELVPNIIEIVRRHAPGEKNALRQVMEVCCAVSSASGQEVRLQAESFLTDTVKLLFSVTEAYPGLTEDADFMELRRESSALENEIQLARNYYNGTVRDFNAAIRAFPAVLISGRLGYAEAAMFGPDDEASGEQAKIIFA